MKSTFPANDFSSGHLTHWVDAGPQSNLKGPIPPPSYPVSLISLNCPSTPTCFSCRPPLPRAIYSHQLIYLALWNVGGNWSMHVKSVQIPHTQHRTSLRQIACVFCHYCRFFHAHHFALVYPTISFDLVCHFVIPSPNWFEILC